MVDATVLKILDQVLNYAGLYKQQTYENEGNVFYIRSKSEMDKPQYLYIQNIETEQVHNPQLWIDTQAVLYETLKVQVEQSPDYLKNVSCLLCINEAEVNTAKAQVEAFTLFVEEDPYYFKKFVLCYTSKEAQKLLDELTDNGVASYIEKVLQDAALFEAYTHNSIQDTAYELMVKLLIKLPFIPLHFQDQRDAPKLAVQLMRAVEQAQLDKLRKKFNSNDKNAIDSRVTQLIQGLESDEEKGLSDVETFLLEWLEEEQKEEMNG
jgi:hypothetical protein